MIEAAGKLGFEAKGVRAEPEALKMIQLPTIAHVIVNEVLYHFVVVYGVSDKHITYMDPADGEMHRVAWDAFLKLWTGVLILLEPKDGFVQGNMKTSIPQRFFQLLRPHRRVMAEVLFGAVVCSILGLSTSVYVGKIVDYVLVDENTNLLNLMGVAMLAIILIRVFISTTKSILALKTSQMIDATLILGYYKHILHLPQQFFDTMRVGEIISRVNDAVKIRTFINNVLVDLVVNVLILIFAVGVMFVYSWKLALVTLVSAPLFLVVFFLFNRLNKRYQRKIMETAADLESQLVESLNAITTIKRFGIEAHANLKTESRFVRLLRNTYVSAQGAIFASNGIDVVSSVVTVAVLWVGSNLVINQTLTPGSLMIFYSLIGYVLSPIGSLISSNQTIQDAQIAADRLFQILDLETESTDASTKVKMELRHDGRHRVRQRFFSIWFAQAGVFVAQSCSPQGQNHGCCWRKRVGKDHACITITEHLPHTVGANKYWSVRHCDDKQRESAPFHRHRSAKSGAVFGYVTLEHLPGRPTTRYAPCAGHHCAVGLKRFC